MKIGKTITQNNWFCSARIFIYLYLSIISRSLFDQPHPLLAELSPRKSIMWPASSLMLPRRYYQMRPHA